MAKHRTSHPTTEAPALAEAEVFRAAVRDVKPLAHKPKAAALIPGATKPRPRRRKPAPEAQELMADMPLVDPATAGGGAAADGLQGSTALLFQRGGVRNQVIRRLRRGLIPIEDELDLHGLTQTAARDQLADFLQNTRAAGIRCVRIIHGKGYRSGARGPILKIAVDLWLRRHLDVMAFSSARPIDGGTGAVYVLLRA
jgi:DNA-nicking Smr family endonuclease